MFTKIGVIGLLTYAGLAAQEVNNQPRIIADAKLAACINHLGQNMVQNGATTLPMTITLQVSSMTASDQEAKPIGDPVTAACVDLLAQNLVQGGAATVPFVIRATPAR